MTQTLREAESKFIDLLKSSSLHKNCACQKNIYTHQV